jgi:hypothetical protein
MACGSPLNWARAIPTRRGGCGGSPAGESPGKHTITVRATDNAGAAQTADQVGTVPDGATDWHTVDFAVAET